MDIRGKTGIISRAVVISVAVMAAAGLSVAGSAQAAPAQHAPSRMISRPVSNAQSATTSAKPDPCFHTFPDCTSSDPKASFGLRSSGDTSGCSFELVIQWGDKSRDTKVPLTGGPDGTPYGPFPHTYDKPGTYPINWTSTLESNTGLNSCVNSSGAYEFTLITAGIYADFKTLGSVKQAADDGWGLIGNVAGLACSRKVGNTCPNRYRACATQSYVHSTGSDLAVERGLSIQESPYYPAWISYWTPAVPAVGASLYGAGYIAGEKAGEEIEASAGKVIRASAPIYVGLDFEGSPAEISCGKDVKIPQAKKNGDKQCWDWDAGSKKQRNCFLVSPAGWKEFALGWKAGILTSTTPLTLAPAVYVNSSEYRKSGEDAGSWGLPVIIATSPIIRPETKPVQTGPNIVGYAAYNDGEAPCSLAGKYIAEVRDWGGISTIQFSDPNPSTYCKP